MIEMEKPKRKRLSYTLFVEKYRPTTIQEVLLPVGLKRFFIKIVKEGEVPNLLFYSSSPGVGKTTVAKALANDIQTDYLYINTSLEGGIDTLRSKIEKFATSMSMSGKKKIVILDEFDGATLALQKALRASIEEFHNTCRFIFTCNYITHIIEPLKSRCQIVDFNFTDGKTSEEMKPKIFKRLGNILKYEKIEYDEKVLGKLVEELYPDIRKMQGLLQQYHKQNIVIDGNIFNYECIDSEFFDLIINKKWNAARKYIIEKNYNYDELYRALFDNLIPKIPQDKKAQIILIIGDYMKWSPQVIDKEIHFSCCMLEIIGVL